MNCIIAAWGEHEAELRGFLTRQLGDPVLAEDLLQDTFLRAMAQGAKFCSLENPRAWLFRVARNLLIDSVRRKRNISMSDDVPDELPEEIQEIAVIERLDVCLPRALTELSMADREAIEACDLGGMTQREYADHQGLTLVAAKSRVQRARKRLKQVLTDLCSVNFDESGQICCFDRQGKNSCCN